ncbi:MAG: HAE1 family hydrophobic/amphiphilic exporter-1 [Candidatus Omnitrophota bacterium]|jgi:HAE1 family hydrophobic/amphiphilic exporter-1
MNLPSVSVRRPTSVMMMAIALIIMGAVSLLKLPVELYPNTSMGEISIVVNVRGQIPPTEVEAQVTRLVEEAVATTSNLKQIMSITKEGESTVILSFEPGIDMDFAALEVREKFAKIKNKLPKEIEKPIIAKFKQSDVAVMVVAFTSAKRTPEQIRKIVDEWVKERFKRVGGVANVEVAGGRERKILVELDMQKMYAYGVTSDEITGTLGSNNLNLLSGDVEREDDKLLIRMIGEFETIEEIQKIMIRSLEFGSALRLEDLATVKDGYLDPKEHSRLNVKDNVSLYIQKESIANTIKVCANLLKEKEFVASELPKDINMVVTSNQAGFIEKAIESLKGSLLRGTLLIFLVLFLFLFIMPWYLVVGIFGLIVATIMAPQWVLLTIFMALLILILLRPRLRPVLIVVSPIPIAVVSTFLFMRFGNLTLNVMTLFGLALGVGMLVDNAIVVFDNILKKREEGAGMEAAAIEGSQELLVPIIASTLTTVIVFLPMIFMSKEIQLLYSSMAMTVIFSLLISLLCAVTIVPMVASRKWFASHLGNMNAEGAEDWAAKAAPFEKKILFKTMRHSKLMMVMAGVLFVGSMFFASKIPGDLLGSTEQNKFTVFVEMPTGVKLEVSNDVVHKVEKIVDEIPELKSVTARVEAWSSKVYVELVDPKDRTRSVDQVIESIRPQTARLEPAFIYFEQEEQVGTKEIIVEVFGFNYKSLRQLAIGITNRMEQVAGLTDLKIRMREGRPEMRIEIDKNKAASLDLNTQQIADQVHGAMRGLRATVFHEAGKEVETITRLQEKYRKTFRDLYKMVITNKKGEPLLLEQVANFKFDLGPSEIWRKNRERMIQVSGNLGNLPLVEAVAEVRQALSDLEFPEDYSYRIGGDYDKLIKSQKEMKLIILMVLILVYLVLASLFESYIQPFLIMVSVPLALSGAIILLYFGPRTIGMGALLGMMMLAGIVVNHSIMLVERINYYRKEKNIQPIKSVILANKDRLRPILLTTCTTILGLIPMALDKGEGANLWSPLALTVIGGLISSLVLTLCVTPSFYIGAIAFNNQLKRLYKFISK